jgi:hypothetical protein
MKANNCLSLGMLMLGVLFTSMSVQGNVLTYDTWTSNELGSPNYILTIDDSTAGKFNYNLTIDPWNAQALGLFVDFGSADPSPIGSVADVGFADTSAANGYGSLEARLYNINSSSTSCGSGCKINGLPNAIKNNQWEMVFRFGENGGNNLQQSFSWVTNTFGLGLSDFGLVALRSQVYCNDGGLLPDDQSSCEGSDKSYSSTSTPGIPPSTFSVPEPATLLLFCFGLFGMVFSRRQLKA